MSSYCDLYLFHKYRILYLYDKLGSMILHNNVYKDCNESFIVCTKSYNIRVYVIYKDSYSLSNFFIEKMIQLLYVILNQLSSLY